MKKIFLLCFILIFLFTGCSEKKINLPNSNEKSNTGQTTDEIIQPVEGGSLKANITAFETLNPFLNNNERVKQILNLSLEGLVTINEMLKAVPQLAVNWDISGNVIKFYLNKDVKWQDGKPFTSLDVKFTFDGFLDKNSTSPYKDIITNYVSSYKTNGDYEFDISLKKPVANPVMFFTFPIMAEHQFKDKADILNKDIIPIGTGPYKISLYNINREVVFEKNSYYRKQPPHINNIIFKIVPDENASITSFQSREGDFTFVSDIDWDKYKENPDVNVYKYITQNYVFLAINHKNSALNDINVRRAFSFGINIDKILKEIYFNHGIKSQIAIRPDSWLWDNNLKSNEFDYKLSDKILENSGWILNNGIRNNQKINLVFNLAVNSNSPDLIKTAQYIKNDLNNIGIQINIIPKKWDDLVKSVYSGNYDIALMEWHLAYNQDLSSELMTNASDNFMLYSDPQLDNIYNSIFNSNNEKDLKMYYHKLESFLMYNQPFIGLFYKDSAVMAYNNIININPISFDIFNNIENWFIKR